MLLISMCPRAALANHYFFPQVRDRIERQVNAELERQGFLCRGETICGLQVIPSFYQNRDYDPVWFNADGIQPIVQPLIQFIMHADREGLNPPDYHLAVLEQLLAELTVQSFPPDESQANQWADFDLLLTDAFLLLASHMSGGRINPETLHADWLIKERTIDLLAFLNTAATAEQLEDTFAQLRPAHRGYSDLKTALKHMRELEQQGGWPRIEGRDTLRPGDRDERVPVMRQRLMISGDLGADQVPADAPEIYDEDLAAAVKVFQRRHGLEADGLIGLNTMAAMNITATRRARQLEFNLERWRWLPRDLGERYIVVNTADFSLDVMEGLQNILHMKAVVGRPARRTPVFSTTMSYLVLNPYWTIPRTIAVEDILPKLAAGVDYLTQQNIKVFGGWSDDSPEIDPLTVPWHEFNKNYFPLRLRQEPGKTNALGRIKFIFPNKFAVYLHDTPQRALFNRAQRDFSSGCIRVERASALAAYLLSGNPDWTPEKLERALQQDQRLVLRLPRPIAVHLLYMTAWVDEDGVLQFRTDIYDRDRDLETALSNRNPDSLLPLADSQKNRH